VDDAIILTKEPGKANQIIADIKKYDLDLDKQGNSGLAEYLGIDIKKHEDISLEMSQRGLIGRIIKSMDLKSVNGKITPVVATLSRQKDAESFNSHYNYCSVVGMLLYLANTTRPDIAFAVNQCACFSNDPKEPHATALKQIGCYLKTTDDKGIIIRKTQGIPMLDCWVDADLKDPTSVRSRTRFVITLGGNPAVWQSKLQTEIALSLWPPNT